MRTGAPAVLKQTYSNYFMNGASNQTFESCIFNGSGYQQAALLIHNANNVMFRNCRFYSSGWNDVSINHDTGRTIENITFDGCYFLSCGRMGFECTGRDDDTCYKNITLRNCIFEPCASQAISFDGPPVYADVLVDNVWIRGAGLNSQYDHGFELNGIAGVRVNRLRMDQVRGLGFNLNGPEGKPCQWVFTGCVADMSVKDPMQTVNRRSDAQVLLASTMNNSVWRNCLVREVSPGGGVMYLSNCDDNDFTGVIFEDASGRFEYDARWETNGCTNNWYNFDHFYGPTGKYHLRSASATYSTARAGGTITLNPYGANYVGQDTGFECYETFYSFDTSAIPDHATVIGVDLWMNVADDESITDFTIEARSYDWGDTLTTSDWVPGADLDSYTLLASLATNGISTGWNRFDSTAAFASAINKGGPTRIMLCSSRHRLGNQPSGLEDVGFNIYNPNMPALRVTWTV